MDKKIDSYSFFFLFLYNEIPFFLMLEALHSGERGTSVNA